jgi:competence protein ComEA
VEKPGIYELPDSARLNDLLIKAGGISADADRDWVAKNFNLADKLVDGEKIYLPTISEISHFGDLGLSTSGQVAGTSAKVATPININTASASQLDTLYGVGEARAKSIIDGRPYQKIEDLVSRKIISQSIYDRIKEQITVY